MAASRDSGPFSSGGNPEGKQFSSSPRAISSASLAIWLGSLLRPRLREPALPGFVAGLQFQREVVQHRQQDPVAFEGSRISGRCSRSSRTIVLYRMLASFGMRVNPVFGHTHIASNRCGIRPRKEAMDAAYVPWSGRMMDPVSLTVVIGVELACKSFFEVEAGA